MAGVTGKGPSMASGLGLSVASLAGAVLAWHSSSPALLMHMGVTCSGEPPLLGCHLEIDDFGG